MTKNNMKCVAGWNPEPWSIPERTPMNPPWNQPFPAFPGGWPAEPARDQVHSLMERIEALTRENEALRIRISALEAEKFSRANAPSVKLPLPDDW